MEVDFASLPPMRLKRVQQGVGSQFPDTTHAIAGHAGQMPTIRSKGKVQDGALVPTQHSEVVFVSERVLTTGCIEGQSVSSRVCEALTLRTINLSAPPVANVLPSGLQETSHVRLPVRYQ